MAVVPAPCTWILDLDRTGTGTLEFGNKPALYFPVNLTFVETDCLNIALFNAVLHSHLLVFYSDHYGGI